MGKLPDDGQKPHTRPTGWDERAQHREIPSFSPGGKWGVWAAEVSVLTVRNGSAADIEHPEGGPARGERSESNLTGMRSSSGGSAPVSNGGCDR